MRLVSIWRHYLDFECNDCGETTHVDAARNFPTEVACRSGKCRIPSQKHETVAACNHSEQIEIPAGALDANTPKPAHQ